MPSPFDKAALAQGLSDLIVDVDEKASALEGEAQATLEAFSDRLNEMMTTLNAALFNEETAAFQEAARALQDATDGMALTVRNFQRLEDLIARIDGYVKTAASLLGTLPKIP